MHDGHERPRRDYYDLAAGRRWSGLSLRLWRFARAEHSLEAAQAGRPFAMNDGFHCACGSWAITHAELGGGAVSNIREAYVRWADHIRDVAARDAPSSDAAPTGRTVTPPERSGR